MTRAVLDTDILSEVLKKKHPVVTARATDYLAAWGRFTLTVVSVLEVTYGLCRVGSTAKLDAFARLVRVNEVLHLDTVAAETSGNILSVLEHRGHRLELPDVMIAAIALREGLPVVTGNLAHFQAIQDAGYSLTIENWRESAA